MTLFERWLKDNQVQYDNCRIMPGYHHHTDLMGKIDWTKFREWRKEAISQFSFAILNDKTVKYLSKHGPFLEVGCGTGYWAYELMKAGSNGTGTIIATDPEPYSDVSSKPVETHLPIDRLKAIDAIDKHGAGRTLLIVWPSYDNEWASEALAHFHRTGGKKLVYVGEHYGGCCATEGFFDMLDKDWDNIGEFTIPQWRGIHDYLTIWERKT